MNTYKILRCIGFSVSTQFTGIYRCRTSFCELIRPRWAIRLWGIGYLLGLFMNVDQTTL